MGSDRLGGVWVQGVVLVGGLAVLLAGGEALVRGAAGMARRLSMSEALIGLTVVAFGTSAPELVVCLVSATRGASEIAFGNVLGSNSANLGLLLGITAMVRPLRVASGMVSREIPMLVLVSLAALALGLDRLLGEGTEGDLFSRGDGLVLLCFFAIFLYANARDVMGGRGAEQEDPVLGEAGQAAREGRALGLRAAVGLTLVGLVGLAAGGHLVVGAASELARALGVAEVVIGVTIVAVGTSLPELVTCLAAARKGHDDLAIGNLVGSNVFNLLFVLGATATVLPVPVPRGGWIDLLVAAAFAAALLPMAATRRRVSRAEGALLLAGYLAYLVWQAGRGAPPL